MWVIYSSPHLTNPSPHLTIPHFTSSPLPHHTTTPHHISSPLPHYTSPHSSPLPHFTSSPSLTSPPHHPSLLLTIPHFTSSPSLTSPPHHPSLHLLTIPHFTSSLLPQTHLTTQPHLITTPSQTLIVILIRPRDCKLPNGPLRSLRNASKEVQLPSHHTAAGGLSAYHE